MKERLLDRFAVVGVGEHRQGRQPVVEVVSDRPELGTREPLAVDSYPSGPCDLGYGTDKMARLIRDHVGGGPWKSPQTRAKVIARTETRWAQNQSTIEATAASGVKYVQAVDDQIGHGDTDCSARNGQVYPIAEAAGIEEMATRVAAAGRAAAEQVEAAAEAARSDIQGRLGEVVEEASTEGKEHADRLRKVEADASESAKAATARLAEYREQAAELVSIIGNTGLIGRFQEVANHEKKAADNWRWAAAALFMAGIAASVATLLVYGVEARVLISIPLIAFGAFAAFESRTHRKREHLNRDLELQLASLDAYLESLDKAKAQEIKSAIAPRFFVGRGKAPRFSVGRGKIEQPDQPFAAGHTEPSEAAE